MLPYDAASVVTIVVAAICLLAAALLRGTRLRLALVFVAALIIRVDPARQSSIHPWDEQLHALVARHFIDHPLQPTLYEQTVLPANPSHWTENHVWLHKPPLAPWLMALSMSIFGVSAFVMRLPSVLLSSAGVLLTFVIGRRLLSDRVGILAASFQAVNGLLVNLASGRRVCDHVDTVLIACVEAGIAVVLTAPPAWRRWLAPLLAGVAMGAGLLAKSAPALLVAFVAAAVWFDRRAIGDSVKRLALLLVTAVVVAAPWTIYANVRFPAESAAGVHSIVQHMTDVLDGSGGPWWVYLKDMPHSFGDLVYIPVIWFLVRFFRRGATRMDWALLVWLATPYVVFSMMPTKLPAFVAIGAPALFVIQAAFWYRLKDSVAKRPAGSKDPASVAAAVLLGLLAILPARLVLETHGPFERRDRWPASTRQLMTLNAELGKREAVIFNMPQALEAMFYSSYTVYRRMPSPAEVEELHRRSISIVIFVPAGTARVPVPDDWRASYLEEATGR
jgi:4-amino-4-deoxy-L-arabinose transferase